MLPRRPHRINCHPVVQHDQRIVDTAIPGIFRNANGKLFLLGESFETSALLYLFRSEVSGQPFPETHDG